MFDFCRFLDMNLLQINYKAWHCLPPPPPEVVASADAGSDDDSQTLAIVLGRKRKESPVPDLLRKKPSVPTASSKCLAFF